jgi:CheY-like chemotaxis protein
MRFALVVESDASSASVVCQSLKDLGFGVMAVASGVDAVIAARQNPPAVIFLAIQLRDVSGVDLATWLRANPTLVAVPIVAMHSSEEDTPDLRPGVFNASLRKPTSPAKVAEVVRETCARIP